MPYLDYAASAPLRPACKEAWLAASEAVGNAASPHAHGQAAARRVERARRQVAAIAGAGPREVTFTSGGTESDNLALFGVLLRGEKRHLVVSAIEHKAVLAAAVALEKRGYEVSVLPVGDDGVVRVAALEGLLRADTALVSVMAVNNETGVVQPVAAIAERAHAAGALMHTDAVQAAGYLPLDGLGADLVSVSAHKLGGPQGVGALISRVPLAPQQLGGAHERGRRAGTLNVAGIAAFGVACELALAERDAEASRVAALRDRLRERVLAAVPGGRAVGRPEALAPHILALVMPGLVGESLVLQLDLAGVSASTGAACSAIESEPSHVLSAMGLSEAEVAGSLRLSLGWASTEAEVDEAARAIADTANRLLHLRPMA